MRGAWSGVVKSEIIPVLIVKIKENRRLFWFGAAITSNHGRSHILYGGFHYGGWAPCSTMAPQKNMVSIRPLRVDFLSIYHTIEHRLRSNCG